MPPLVIMAIKAFMFLQELKASGVPQQLQADAAALAAALGPHLPPPPDGVAWTKADLEAMAAEHFTNTDKLRQEHGTTD